MPMQLLADTTSTNSSQIAELAALSTWRKLIHLEETSSGGFETDVVTANFFQSPGIPEDPAQELVNTLKGFFSKPTADVPHAQCRYPARLYWLSIKAPELVSGLPEVQCPELDAWKSKTEGRQFHLVHVSGYFSNPASAFGHLLLRIGDDGGRGLLDTGINFGARIPPTDGSLVYVLKGLMGGYTASFSSKQHYLQDHVYAGTESRDMWAYELNLTDQQRSLLSLHLWELRDQQFKYFFLRKNCAYRIAEVLGMVMETDFVKHTDLSYAPIKLFNRLHRENVVSERKLYSDINFVPSFERSTHNQFQSLSESDRESALKILETESLDYVEESATTDLLDFLLEYQDFKIATDVVSKRESHKNFKRQVVAKRLLRPEKSLPAATVAALKEPGAGVRPSLARLTFGSNETQRVELSPYWFGVKDNNRGSLYQSSFRAFGLSLEYQSNELEFDRLTLLEIQKFLPTDQKSFSGPRFAWSAGGAIVRREDCEGSCIDGEVYGGIGFSNRVGGNALLISMVNSSVTTSLRDQELSFSIGSVFNPFVSARVQWQSGYRFYTKGADIPDWWHLLGLRYSLSKDFSLNLGWESDVDDVFEVGFQYKW